MSGHHASPLRVLHTISSVDLAQGGAAEGLRQYAMAFAARGQRFDVVTLDPPGTPWAAAFPAPTHALGPGRGKYRYTPRLSAWLDKHVAEYDAVVIHGLWQYHGFATMQAARKAGVPYFVYTHGMLDPWFKRTYPFKHLKKWLYWPWGEYRVLRDAKAVLFTTEEEARLAPTSFWLYRAKAIVAGWGMTIEGALRPGQPDRFLEAHPQLVGKRLVLFLARIHPKKGCDLLIEAFAQVASSDGALHLVMAGPDHEGTRPGLEALAQRLGIANRMTWTGMLSGDFKWGALRAAEVFVLPSHQENFGVAVVESLAVGVPVLISNQVNIWREIDRYGAGYVADDTVEGTAALLKRWLSTDAATRASMSQAARMCYAQCFHISAAADKLVDVIEQHLPAQRTAA